MYHFKEWLSVFVGKKKNKTSFLLIMHILYQWTSQSILDFCIYVYSRSCAVWCKCMHIHFGVDLG